MSRSIVVILLATFGLLFGYAADAQQAKIYRIGVVHEGGPDNTAIAGLKEGLKELGLAEGVNYVLENRDLKGDRLAAKAVAETLEREKVDLIYAIATSVALPVKTATTKIPIVFAAGSDPVASGLVESFAKPGGRLTGVYYSTTELTAKRLQVLKTMVPNLRKVVTFYDPANPFAIAGLKSLREAAGQLQIEIVEKPVASVPDLRAQLAAFKAQDADALFYINDAMVRSQAQLIIETMNAKKVPTMFSFAGSAAQGALAGYGVSFRDVGHSSARYVQKILAGTNPRDLPVESVSRMELTLNINTARTIGLAIPQAVRLSASEVIE